LGKRLEGSGNPRMVRREQSTIVLGGGLGKLFYRRGSTKGGTSSPARKRSSQELLVGLIRQKWRGLYLKEKIPAKRLEKIAESQEVSRAGNGKNKRHI